MEDQKNFVMAMILSIMILMGYHFFFAAPMAEKEAAKREAQIEIVEEAIPTPVDVVEMPQVESLRIPIDTPSLEGSFQTRGSRFDDIKLRDYQATTDENSPIVSLLNPEGGDLSAYVFDNWAPVDGGTGANAEWALVSGDTLTPTSPVVLRHEGPGYAVERTVSVDDKYLITLSDVVTNSSSANLSLVRHGVSRQVGLRPDLENFYILQEGPISVVDNRLFDMKFGKLAKDRRASSAGESGWVGITDKYWLAAAVAPIDKQMTVDFEYSELDEREIYEASYEMAPITLSPGASQTSVGYIFAGAKERSVLERYEAEFQIDEFNRAIDWGTLRIIVKPLTTALNWLGHKIGNYGIAIMVLTFIIRLVLFPLFRKQYASMASMKKVAPELTRLRDVYGDDRMKLQQEMMALYKREGVNPMAGCLPIIPTIFIFFALYKTVFIDVELRHAPFLWISDLSQRDPLSIQNLFGILPWDGNILGITFLALGPLALLYGITMAMMQTLQTPGGDPMQRKIFMFLPWVFMFVLAPFAAGLLVYWVTSNILSFLQSYIIYKRMGIDIPLEEWIKRKLGKSKALPEGMDVIDPGQK